MAHREWYISEVEVLVLGTENLIVVKRRIAVNLTTLFVSTSLSRPTFLQVPSSAAFHAAYGCFVDQARYKNDGFSAVCPQAGPPTLTESQTLTRTPDHATQKYRVLVRRPVRSRRRSARGCSTAGEPFPSPIVPAMLNLGRPCSTPTAWPRGSHPRRTSPASPRAVFPCRTCRSHHSRLGWPS